MHSRRPIRAEISLSALKHNYALAKRTAPNASVFAVVKANAYGHGLARVARALTDADGFATLELDSAIALREQGIRAPILMLEGFFDEKELPFFSRHDLMTVVRDVEQINQLTAQSLTRPIDTFLKFNTGMNRLGFQGGTAGFALNTAATHRNFGAVTLMTHFATADHKLGITAQLRHFDEILAQAQPLFRAKPFAQSLANSAALLRYPETHRDWVRPGIMLYGSSPFAETDAHALGLKPVMALRSEIIAVQSLEPGDAVGYGATFVAQKKMRVGVVACGYADGYPRAAPGTNTQGTPVIVSGKRTRTVGRVSMDMMVVDLTEMPHVHKGAPVTLWGEGLSADEVAAAAGTISYELFCGITARVPMVEVD
jgi:alanine racemase